MVPEFVARTRGSAVRNSCGALSPEFSENEESWGSSLWPKDSRGLRGSQWNRALPGW